MGALDENLDTFHRGITVETMTEIEYVTGVIPFANAVTGRFANLHRISVPHQVLVHVALKPHLRKE